MRRFYSTSAICAAVLLLAASFTGCSSDIEGDAPGECEDGADNDRDGAFDCDDSDCSGAPACKNGGGGNGGNGSGGGGTGGNVSVADWLQIDSAGVHNCGVQVDDTVLCWGGNAQGQSTPPSGSFTETRVSFFHSCGLGSDGALLCWGCKGDKDYGQCEVPTTLTDIIAFDTGTYSTCVVDGSGTAECWGCSGTDHGQCTPPADEVLSDVALGSLHACGLAATGVVCWGNDDFGQSTPPSGIFSQLSAGTWHTCGVRDDQAVVCWGCSSPSPDSPADFGQCDAPAGSFEQVAAGVYHSCGLKTDGTVVCWGCIGSHDGNATDTGQCTPPDQAFTSIGVGKFHGCGLEPDSSVSCWGNDYYGQLAVP